MASCLDGKKLLVRILQAILAPFKFDAQPFRLTIGLKLGPTFWQRSFLLNLNLTRTQANINPPNDTAGGGGIISGVTKYISQRRPPGKKHPDFAHFRTIFYHLPI